MRTLSNDKMVFKMRNVSRNKEGYFIMFKGSIHQEDITIISTKYLARHQNTISKIDRIERRNRQFNH